MTAEDPAFVLPADPLFDTQRVEFDDGETLIIHGGFAVLGPWQEDLVLKVGERSVRIPIGDQASFHTIAKTNV